MNVGSGFLDTEFTAPLNTFGTLEAEKRPHASLPEDLEHLAGAASHIHDRGRLEHVVNMPRDRPLSGSVIGGTVLFPERLVVHVERKLARHGLTRSQGYSLTGLKMMMLPCQSSWANLKLPIGMRGWTSATQSAPVRAVYRLTSATFMPKMRT